MFYFGDGVSCEDVDECSVNSMSCPFGEYCSNTAGSFACTCKNEVICGQKCEIGWKEGKFGSKTMCYKYVGQTRYIEAEKECRNFQARLPVPRSDKERDDFFATLEALGRTRTRINSDNTAILFQKACCSSKLKGRCLRRLSAESRSMGRFNRKSSDVLTLVWKESE